MVAIVSIRMGDIDQFMSWSMVDVLAQGSASSGELFWRCLLFLPEYSYVVILRTYRQNCQIPAVGTIST